MDFKAGDLSAIALLMDKVIDGVAKDIDNAKEDLTPEEAKKLMDSMEELNSKSTEMHQATKDMGKQWDKRR
jgi:hypothetical protein